MALIRTILVPMDHSGGSIAALEYASSLAELCSAKVDVLHVHDHDDFKVGSSVPLAPEALREAEQHMDEAIARATNRLGDRLRRTTKHGDPLKTIVEAAGEGDFDLIVMGTSGRIGRLYMIVGSVAEGVIRNAPCPVLTVRVHEGEESLAERLRGGASLADLVRARQGVR
ncbi:MAG: universal stress protein [Polyangiaceae bacterium]|nr:universal stress protein [Polyangiaceae bacterium]